MMVFDISKINAAIREDPKAMIIEQESVFKAQIINIADVITKESRDIRIVMLSGPSSSGKTTASAMLYGELLRRGCTCHVVSLDNFYNPDFENVDGKPDFESVEALNLELLKDCFYKLRQGMSVRLPLFDFASRKANFSSEPIKLSKGDCVVVEGIHALNPTITDLLAPDGFLGVYLSFESSFAIEGKVVLDGADARLLRRVVRDYHFRNSSVENSLSMWENVLSGEKRNIEPFKYKAHMELNSGFAHDPGTLKPFAEKLFSEVPQSSIYHEQCRKINEILRHFDPIPSSYIPSNSLLREFIG